MKILRNNNVAQTLLVMLLGAVVITVSGGLALLVRFDFSFESIPDKYLNLWIRTLPIQIAAMLFVFLLRKMYRYIWRYVSARDVLEMALSVCLAYGAFHLPAWLLACRQPRSVLFIELLCQVFLLIGMRCSIRLFRAIEYSAQNRQADGERIMLVGAGEAGRILLQEITSASQMKGRVCGMIDDDPAKQGKIIENVPVAGGREAIPQIAKKEQITQIILAIPSATAAQKKEILRFCQQTNCRVRILPPFYQIVSGEVDLSAV